MTQGHPHLVSAIVPQVAEFVGRLILGVKA